MNVLAEFEVLKSGQTRTLQFVTSTEASHSWRFSDGTILAATETFALLTWKVFHLTQGRSISVTCPGSDYKWRLKVTPSTGSGTVMACAPWLGLTTARAFRPLPVNFSFTVDLNLPRPWKLKVDATAVTIATRLVEWQFQGSTLIPAMDVSGDPFFVEVMKHGGNDEFIRGQLVQRPFAPEGTPDATQRVIELSAQFQRSPPHQVPPLPWWPLHRPMLTQTIRLSWAADSVGGAGRVRWRLVQRIESHTKAFVELWGAVIAPYLTAFTPIREGHQESVVAELSSGKFIPDTGVLTYLVSLPEEFCDWKPVNNTFIGAPSKDSEVHLESWLPEGDDAANAGVDDLMLTMPKFLLTSGESLKITAENARIEKSEGSTEDEDIAEVARLVLHKTMKIIAPDGSSLRDGALNLELSSEAWERDEVTQKAEGSQPDSGVLRVRAQNPATGGRWWVTADVVAAEQEFFHGARLSPVVEGLVIPVSAVLPGGQDAVPGDDYIAPHRQARLPPSQLPSLAPVILAIGEAKEKKEVRAKTTRYLLTCREHSGWQRSATLELELHQSGSQSNEPGEVLVLDTAPFGVVRVKHEPLSIANAAEMTLLARRSTGAAHGASWELRDVDGDLEIMLPPQGVGEAMEKAKTKPKPDGTPGDPLYDIQEGELADFRITPGARLTLEASYFAKRYVEPPWNTRRQFGWAGQRDPGAGIKKLEFELLYGLSCEVTKPWLRLADLLARTGALPRLPAEALAWKGTEEQRGRFDTWSRDQQALALAIRSRLGVLEVWDQRQPEGLKLKDGVECFPRVEKGAPSEPRGAQLRFPLLRYDENDRDLKSLKEELHNEQDGLAGGFTWAFESGNIYKEFWRNRRSSSAALEGLWFSALGGWGHQTARFAGDKTVIESRVSMGRTHFYVLERIGRIGVFWNKAKHVILYERVTGRTRQFGDESDGPTVFQDAHAGRPILRKVREYVEILEPERFFPDFPGDEAHHCGFVTGCVFRSKIMPVKSTWGRDVKAWGAPISGAAQVTREGWEIPLWQEGSDAITYPKPQIELEVITDPDAGDAGKMRVGLDQPQRLFFFTETTDGTTADVHAWNPFPWTDYCDLPEPVILKLEEPVLSPDAPDAPLPDAEEELPGYERFTFKVVAGAPQASVTARRVTEAGMSATLRNVSMMRSVPESKLKLPDPATQEGQTWMGSQAGKDWINQNPHKAKAWLAHSAIHEARTRLVDARDGNIAAIRQELDSSTATAAGVAPKLKAWLETAFSVPGANIEKVKEFVDSSNLLPELKSLVCQHPFDPKTLGPVGKHLWKHANHQAKIFHDFVDQQVIAPPFERIDSAMAEAAKLNDSTRDKLIADVEDARKAVRTSWRGFQGVLDTGLAAPRDAMWRFLDQFRAEFTRLSAHPDAWLAELQALTRRADADVAAAQAVIKARLKAEYLACDEFIRHLERFLDKAVEEARKLAGQTEPDWLKQLKSDVSDDLKLALEDLRLNLKQLFLAADMAADQMATGPELLISELDSLRDCLRRERARLLDDMAGLTTEWETAFNSWMTTTISSEIEGVEGDISNFVQDIDTELAALQEGIRKIAGTWSAGIAKLRKDFFTCKDHGRKKLIADLSKALCNLLKDQVVPRIVDLDSMLGLQKWQKEIAEVSEWFKTASGLADVVLGRLESAQRLYDALYQSPPDWNAARRELDQVLKDAGTEFRGAAGEVLAHSRKLYETADAAGALQQEASRTLRSVRALCDALTAPGLGFNRKTVALFYQARGTVIGMTPCVAKMRELGDQLQSLGLRLPTAEISERLKGLRDKLPQFNFGTILADLGLDFSDMFPGFKMPGDFDDYLKLSHDVDEKQMRAWARAELDYQIPERKTLFSIGPIEVALNEARVEGRASIEAELERPVQKSTWARMSGDWEVSIGGTPLVTFVDAEVIMDNGRMDFKLKPEKIVMSAALKMLTDLTEGMSALFGDSGFTLGFVKEGMIPVGLRAVLELPCFDAAGATSGVTGLQLGASFELRALDEDLQLNFSIGAGFHLGRKDKPFNVLIFILGGGGWVETMIYYRPKGNEIVVRVSIGLQVSASLALNFGVVRGSVGVYLGIFVDYTKRTGQSGAMQVGIMLLFRGEVDVLGIISVMLSLLLEVVYLSDGQKKSFYGRGTLALEIRICWCFKIKVRKSVTYNFGGGGGGGGPSPHALPAGHAAALANGAGVGANATLLAPAPAQRTDYTAVAKHYVDYLL